MRFYQTVVLGLMVMGIFHGLNDDTKPYAQVFTNKLGVMYFCVVNQVMTAIFAALLTFINERPTYL